MINWPRCICHHMSYCQLHEHDWCGNWQNEFIDNDGAISSLLLSVDEYMPKRDISWTRWAAVDSSSAIRPSIRRQTTPWAVQRGIGAHVKRSVYTSMISVRCHCTGYTLAEPTLAQGYVFSELTDVVGYIACQSSLRLWIPLGTGVFRTCQSPAETLDSLYSGDVNLSR